MKKIFNYLDEGVIICNAQGKIVFANDAIISKLGFLRSEIYGANISILLDELDITTSEFLGNLVLQEEARGDIKLITKEKAQKTFKVNLIKEVWEGENAFCLILGEEVCKDNNTIADLERVLDELPYSVWVKDEVGKYVYLNKKHAKEVGKNKADLLFRDDYEIWNEDDADYFKDVDAEVLKHHKPILEQHKVGGFNKDDCWFETYKAPIKKDNSLDEYVMGISREITLEKKMEQELIRSHKDMMTLNNLITANEYDIEKFLNSIKEDLTTRLKADGGSVWIYDEKSTRLNSIISFGISEELNNKINDIFIPKECFKEISNWDNDGIESLEDRKFLIKGKEQLLTIGVKYCGIYKIMYNNQVIGLIHTLYKDKNDYNIKCDDYIKTVCNQLGIIIKNEILSQEIKSEFSKRKQAEEELQLLLDTAVDLIAIIDEDKKFKRVNSGWTEILGWTEEELSTMDSYDIVLPEDRELTELIVSELKTKLSIKGAVNRYISKYGEIYWFDWSSRYIPEKGISICTGRNITNLKKVVEQKELYEKALELEKIKSDFFANISHEFKTPLNIILTIMQLIMKNIEGEGTGFDNEKIIKYMHSIKQNSYRLLRLVNNLIDITKIDSGYYELTLENANIINVIEDITMSVVEYTEEKGIELIFDTEIEELITACDPEKIERIMLNLLSNAIKYSKPAGSIKVDIKSRDERIVVSVEDNGIGIEEDKVDKIFDRFSQVKNTLTRECEGSGIGLSIVKSLVEMHGGVILVESKFGKGTKFTFELPVKLVKKKDMFIESKEVISSMIEKCNIEFSDIYK